MSESVNIIISANDQASAKLAAAAANVDKFGKTAKAGGKAIGAFNQILGSTPFGQYTAGLGNMIGELTEVRTKLADAAEGGKMMKVALGATAIAIGYQIGTMIADWIMQTEKWKEALTDALREAGRVADQLADKRKQQFQQQMELAGTEATPEGRKSAYQALKENIDQQIKEQQRVVSAAQEAADATVGAWTEAGKKQHEIDKQRLEIEKERLRVLRDQSAEAFKAARGPTDTEAEIARRKEAAETRKRIDSENRQRADEMWKREAEEHGKQLQRQKNAADGARRLQEELQERLRAIRDDGNAKRKESEREAFLEMMEWEMEQEEKYIEQSNKAFREKEAKKKDGLPDSVSLNAFESRLLSRGGGVQPIDRIVKNTEQTNKELAEQRRIQQQQLEELRRTNGGVEFGTVGG